MIELNKHTECIAKLMTEINSIDTTDLTNINSKMLYLGAVIMDINRLHLAVDASLKIINRENKLAATKKPIVLRPGMLIYLPYLHLHTSQKILGTLCREIRSRAVLGGQNKSQPFKSFGYGPGNC